MITKNQKQKAIVSLASIGLLIFCTVPFVSLERGRMYTTIEGYSGLMYLIEGEGDLQYYVAMCALIPLSIIILQFLKIKQAGTLTNILSCLSFLALLSTLLNVDGEYYDNSSLLVGAPLLLFIDYAALTYISIIPIEKISSYKLLKGSVALSALIAIATFCTVPFFMPNWPHAAGITGLDMFDLMDFTNDFSPSFSLYSFILIPAIVAILQANKNANFRFFSTLAMWLPLFFFMTALPKYGFTTGAYVYMFLSVVMNCISYHLIGAEKKTSTLTSFENPEQDKISVPMSSKDKNQFVVILITCSIFTFSSLSSFLLQAFSISTPNISYILWGLYAVIIIGSIIKTKNNLNTTSLCGLGLITTYYLSAILLYLYQNHLIKQQDYEALEILNSGWILLLGLLIIALLIFIWSMNITKRIKYTFSALPVLILTGYITSMFIREHVNNSESYIDIEEKVDAYHSLMNYSNFTFFILVAIVNIAVWLALKTWYNRNNEVTHSSVSMQKEVN